MTELPKQGTPWEELERRLKDAGRNDVDWRHGRAPALVHFAGDDVLEVAKRAYLLYFSENGLGPRAFRSLATFEADVVAMGLSLLHGTPQSRGAMTTGGTESIFLAVKAARDLARERGVAAAGTPILVLPYSAHPAFDKAAHFLGARTVRMRCAPTSPPTRPRWRPRSRPTRSCWSARRPRIRTA